MSFRGISCASRGDDGRRSSDRRPVKAKARLRRCRCVLQLTGVGLVEALTQIGTTGLAFIRRVIHCYRAGAKPRRPCKVVGRSPVRYESSPVPLARLGGETQRIRKSCVKLESIRNSRTRARKVNSAGL
jgi:hypothetical protein